jgi:seryl-tRNA synthetase
MQSKSILLRAQKKIQHREDKLRHLAEETKRQAAEAEEMRAERERIRLEIGEMERREEDEDDEMGGLTMQIKQILAKVSEIWGDYCVRVLVVGTDHSFSCVRRCSHPQKTSLRSTLKNVKEMYETAVENRDMWKCKLN